MYYQHTDARYHLRSYQQDADDGRTLLPQHSACLRSSELCPVSGSSSRDFTVFHNPVHDRHAQRPGGYVLPRVQYDHGGTPAPMTSYRRDVTNDVVTMTSPPGPYDCKPPYSYISLIAMAIESSAHHRSAETFHASSICFIFSATAQPIYRLSAL